MVDLTTIVGRWFNKATLNAFVSTVNAATAFAPPDGFVFITDTDGTELADPDGFFLVEAI